MKNAQTKTDEVVLIDGHKIILRYVDRPQPKVMENLKRVYCLYRVSTVGQAEKDDIPMQKQYCREFASGHPDWHIEKELYEKGISGFKKSAKERDAIQEIQREAVQGKFEVLLVYMFDRLGRKDDETPFVVEWFVKNGIEVWSSSRKAGVIPAALSHTATNWTSRAA